MNCEFRRDSETLHVCIHCGRKVLNAQGVIAATCSASDDETPPRPCMAPARAETIAEREAQCEGCPFYVLGEWGADVKTCALLECAPCSSNLQPAQKANLRVAKWRAHLENAEAICLLSDKPRWRAEEPLAKDTLQMNAKGVAIAAGESSQPG